MRRVCAAFCLIMAAAAALRFPAAIRPRASSPVCLTELEPLPPEPRDELKRRFTLTDGSETRTTFTPDKVTSEQPDEHKLSRNEQLRAEIEAMLPAPAAPPPAKLPVDLNGIKPRDLVLGAVHSGWTTLRVRVRVQY